MRSEPRMMRQYFHAGSIILFEAIRPTWSNAIGSTTTQRQTRLFPDTPLNARCGRSLMHIPLATPVPYFALLEAVNECLAGVRNFNFYPGMLFASRDKWWPDSGLRPTAHEGIDICYYTDGAGRERSFSPRIAIPAMAPGRIFAVCRDFLGQSVFINHEMDDSQRFLSVYAHIVLHRQVYIGRTVQAGEVVGTVADTAGRKNRMPAHVHLSLMRIPQTMPHDMLDWKFICSSDQVELIDPLSMLDCDYVAIHSNNPWKEREQARL